MDKYPESEMTTVRFTVDEHPEGTLLRVVESGFENIPEERRAFCYRQNTEGWTSELAKLPPFVESGIRQAKV